MLYSTLSRFQGALWGSLGTTLGKSTVLNELVISQTKNLIESGELTPKQIKSLANLTTSQMAVATLPLILFCHESPQLLRAKLNEIVTKLELPTETLLELLIWGKAISLALTEKLQPETLIKQLLATQQPTQLTEQLEKVQSYLEQNISLHQVLYRLSRLKQQQTAIAIAIYCFLFTPQDFSLATKRAAQSTYQPEITQTLTGILAGVYKGYHNIPLKLRLFLSQNPQQQIRITLATQLYASWCGITPTAIASKQTSTQAIAKPGLIQHREQLKIISQQETW